MNNFNYCNQSIKRTDFCCCWWCCYFFIFSLLLIQVNWFYLFFHVYALYFISESSDFDQQIDLLFIFHTNNSYTYLALASENNSKWIRTRYKVNSSKSSSSNSLNNFVSDTLRKRRTYKNGKELL